MADDAGTSTATRPTNQPPVINGFRRLPTTEPTPTAATPRHTAAPPPPPTPPAATTTPQPPVTASAEFDAEPAGEQPTPYRDRPHLLPEHALLGTLLHAPDALRELDAFLGVRDFATPDTRAVYATLRGLRQAGALADLAVLPTEAQRLHAADTNRLALFTALRATPPPFTTITVDRVPRLIATLTAAAPPESLPFRGVYDPTAQLHLGRMVLEDSIRRQLSAMGVLMQRRTPLVLPARAASQAADRSAQTLATNLQRITDRLDTMTDRLRRALQRTEPHTDPRIADPMTASPDHPTPTPTQPATRPLRLLSVPLRHHAERHILHAALHAGHMHDIPAEILSLAPEDFSTTRHANLWRTITDLKARGLPVNYVSVFRESRSDGFLHHPVPSDRALLRMAEPPDLRSGHLARSLRTLATAGLARATRDTQHAVTALATNTTVPLDAALAQAKDHLGALSARATTAVHPDPPSAAHQSGRHAR